MNSLRIVIRCLSRLPFAAWERKESRSAVFVYLLLLGLLSSCDRGIEPGVLRFSHFWSEPGQRAVMDSVIAQFTTEHPDIKVEVSELSWGDGKTKLMINFNARTAPDVIEFGSDWVPEFSSSGVLEDLSTADSLQRRILATPPYARVCGAWNARYFAVPWFVDTRVLFVNRDLLVRGLDSDYLDNPPLFKSWDQMIQMAKAVQERTGASGIGVNGSDAHRLYKKILPQFWSNGGDIIDSNGKPCFASAKNIEALTFYVKQLDAGVLESQKNLDDLFKRGKLAILFSGAWLLKPLKNVAFHWYCAPFPGPDGKDGVSFAGGEYLAVNSSSQMKAQANELVAFLTRPDIELRLAKAFNIFPADTLMQRDSFYYKRDQGDVFIRQLRTAKMTPVHPKWLEIEAILEDEVAQALYKTKSAAEALQSCDARVASMLKEP